MTGAATSTLVALCAVTLIQVGQVGRLFRIHPFRDDQLRCLLAAGVAAAATASLTLIAWPAPLLEVIAGGALFVTVYAAAVAALGVRAETRELATSARDRLRRRASTW
jgi:hypothetical protein